MEKVSLEKNILIYAHYYYPDTASTGQILQELAEGFVNKGFNVKVISTVPSYTGIISNKYKNKRFYKENIKGVEVIRVRVTPFSKENKLSRIKNIIVYFLNSVLATFKVGKIDYVYTISQPPILGGILGVIGKWITKGKLIYNIQDFNPEQTIAVGYIKNKMILKFSMMLDKFSCKNSNIVIVVGRDMITTLKNRFKNKNVPKYTFINNWINEKEIYQLANDNEKVMEFKKKYNLENKFIIEYSGNLGLYYDLENIIKVIKNFKDYSDVAFVFIGEGAVLNKLKAYAEKNNLANVIFIPYQKKEELIYSLNAGDVHWVINAKGIKGVSVPSKLYGVMAVGKPILGVLEEGSEARLIIEESGCGLCTEPENYEQIKKNILYFIVNKSDIHKLGLLGRGFLEENLKKDLSIDKYVETILKI